MDAQVGDLSQSRRLSIKRPWEDASPEESHPSTLLKPIDTAIYRRLSYPQSGQFPGTRYGPESRESTVKRPKYEGDDYSSFSQKFPDINRGLPPQPIAYSGLFQSNHRGSIDSPIFLQRAAAEGPAESRDTATLCSRCRKLTTQEQELDLDGVLDICEKCRKNPEIAHVTQTASACASALSQLQKTIISSISSEESRLIRGTELRELSSITCPPIAQFGLRQTLDWILSQINHCNYILADLQLVRQVPADTSQTLNKDIFEHDIHSHDASLDIMKRRIDVDSEAAFTARTDAAESSSDAKAHTRRRSVTRGQAAGEEFLPRRMQPDHYPSMNVSDSQASRFSIMNPPPAPHRQLPSPPGRSLPSPTSSLNFPSPSASQFGGTPQGVNLPPPSSLHQSTASHHLPPITSTRSPDFALEEHSAALQHEVSVQKLALTSLQGEHDKLLAAFSRSQLRASALEKKHAVSDGEIISLTEEKMRLQIQVVELERDVDELSRSRDQFRQAAVQEGAQYVEIVKKASRLEEMAGEERKQWAKLKDDMERRIESLSASRAKRGSNMGSPSASDITSLRRNMDDLDTNTPASSLDSLPEMKSEYSMNEAPFLPPTSEPSNIQKDPAKELKEEIERLRERCSQVENALRAIRDDGRSMDGLIKSLLARADSTMNE